MGLGLGCNLWMLAPHTNWPKILLVLSAQLWKWVQLRNSLVSSSLAKRSALLKSTYLQGSDGNTWNRNFWLKWRACVRETGLWSRSQILTEMLNSCRPSCPMLTSYSVHRAIFLLYRKAKSSASGRQIVLDLRFSKKAKNHKLATHKTTIRLHPLTNLTVCGPEPTETENHPVSCQLA